MYKLMENVGINIHASKAMSSIIAVISLTIIMNYLMVGLCSQACGFKQFYDHTNIQNVLTQTKVTTT